MVQGRKIVTAVITLVGLATLACTGQMRAISRGESRLAEMQRIKAELKDTYLITLAPEQAPNELAIKSLKSEARAHVRGLLDRFVTLGGEILRLDDQKGIAVTGRGEIEQELDRARRLRTELNDAGPLAARG